MRKQNKSRPYSLINVNRVSVAELTRGREGQEAWLGLDMSKDTAKAIVAWPDGSFSRAWWLENPGQIPAFLDLLAALGQGRKLSVAMEPTGTYGDALRQALHDRKIALTMILSKASHDYAEIFDGVPSQHDAKDAAVVRGQEAAGPGPGVSGDAGDGGPDAEDRPGGVAVVPGPGGVRGLAAVRPRRSHERPAGPGRPVAGRGGQGRGVGGGRGGGGPGVGRRRVGRAGRLGGAGAVPGRGGPGGAGGCPGGPWVQGR